MSLVVAMQQSTTQMGVGIQTMSLSDLTVTGIRKEWTDVLEELILTHPENTKLQSWLNDAQ